MLVIVVRNIAFAYGADESMPRIRVSTASDKFRDTAQVAGVFDLPAPAYFHAQHLELAIGSIYSATEREAFISLGPVWRMPVLREGVYVDFGFSPTLITGSHFDGRDLGGQFHFTSSLSVGAKIGSDRRNSIAVRIQHTSNGGLNRTNPGLDMVGIEFSFAISK